jgi:hypothetical protein
MSMPPIADSGADVAAIYAQQAAEARAGTVPVDEPGTAGASSSTKYRPIPEEEASVPAPARAAKSDQAGDKEPKKSRTKAASAGRQKKTGTSRMRVRDFGNSFSIEDFSLHGECQ